MIAPSAEAFSGNHFAESIGELADPELQSEIECRLLENFGIAFEIDGL